VEGGGRGRAEARQVTNCAAFLQAGSCQYGNECTFRHAHPSTTDGHNGLAHTYPTVTHPYSPNLPLPAHSYSTHPYISHPNQTAHTHHNPTDTQLQRRGEGYWGGGGGVGGLGGGEGWF